MNLVKAQFLFTKNVAHLITFAYNSGIDLTMGEAFRTEEQQAIYLKKGLSKTMNSMHRKRLAIDLHVFVNGVYRTDAKSYERLAKYWQSLHPSNVAGYYWGWDSNHFEMSYK